MRFKGAPVGNDAVSVTGNVTNHIWDYCTFSFGNDEGASWYTSNIDPPTTETEVSNITVQNCIISENPSYLFLDPLMKFILHCVSCKL